MNTNLNYKKRSKSNIYCSVPQCKTYYSDKMSFHTFPKRDKTLREKWIKAVKITKNVSYYMRVCSKHFRDEDYFFNRRYPAKAYRLKKNAIPSQNLPKTTDDNITLLQNELERQYRKRKIDDQTEAPLLKKSEPTTITSGENDVNEKPVHILLCFPQEEKLVISSPKPQLEGNELSNKATQVEPFQLDQCDMADFIMTNCDLQMLTGIENFHLFNILVDALTKLDNTTWELDSKKLILLTMMHIKMAKSFYTLSEFFNTSISKAKMYFKRTSRNLASILKKTIRSPSKGETSNIALDSFEIEIEKSPFLEFRKHSYSYHKKKHIVKFLTGTSSYGTVVFVSNAYGAKTSNKTIFNKENSIVEMLQSGDVIVADKGFLIEEECAERNIKLIRPSWKNYNYAENSEIVMTRIKAEKFFEKMRIFRILQEVVPWKMLPQVTNVFTIIVGLTNLSIQHSLSVK